jgi:4-amino-4-deoxy-L-arabinose transferase-like glycosyltransferase
MQLIEPNQISAKRLEPWVCGFILLHILLWTWIPTWVRHTLPMDALEGSIWGQQFQWGYDKNPFVNAWLTAVAVWMGNESGWAIYLFSQLSVALGFWSIWELGKKILPPIYALIAILLLAATQYYNLHAIDFNDNTIELSTWGLTILFFYQAVQDNKIKDWLLTGVFAGLAMMTKYFVVVLLCPMLLFMLLFPKTRAQFKTPGIYLGLLLFFIIITPHFIWLYWHDFITLNYAMHRVSSEAQPWNHLFYPARFAWQQLEVFIPALILWGLLFVGKKSKAQPKNTTRVTTFNHLFLLIIGLGPLLLTLLLSATLGMKLRAGWGQPLTMLWSLCLLAWITPLLTRTRLTWFFSGTLSVLVMTLIGYSVALIRAPLPSSANFPGKNIAMTLEQEWHKEYRAPLKYVVGARWLSGNVSFYSHDKPQVFIDANIKVSPWIDENKLRKEGALFVWDPTESPQMSVDEIKKRYPKLGPVKIMHFTWMRNLTMKPVEISVAALPPEIS